MDRRLALRLYVSPMLSMDLLVKVVFISLVLSFVLVFAQDAKTSIEKVVIEALE